MEDDTVFQNGERLQISSSEFDKLKERFYVEKEREQTTLNFEPWVSRKIGLMLSKEE